MQELVNKINTRDFIAIVLTMSLVALTFVLAIRTPDADVFKILLGALLSVGFTSSIGFYFNSSKGSEEKSEFIAATATKQNDVIAASSAALATSVPAPPTVTTVTNDPGPPPTTTVTTAPAPEPPAATTTTAPAQPPGQQP